MRHIRIRILERFDNALRSSTFIERTLFYVFAVLLAGSALYMLAQLNAALLVEVPRSGGTVTEGIIGAPRFINPLLAVSDADRDLTQLVYAGLMRARPDGSVVPELAEDYVVSDNGLTYTFTLRSDARFHDGRRVTADDVVYTITLAQDPALKSPKRPSWEGVRAEALDEQTVRFTLARAYQPFIENTTLGILPKHLWEKTPPEQQPFSTLNVEPVGAGPFRVTDFKRDDADVPTRYTLDSFDRYTLGAPHLDRIVLRFYANEETLLTALERGDVDQANAVSAENTQELGDEYRIETFPLPRVFGVFFNQNRAPVFTHNEVRHALDRALPREQIVASVLSGFGTPATGPIPPGVRRTYQSVTAEEPIGTEERIETAQAILERNGWVLEDGVYVKETKNEDIILAFTLTTANIPELKQAAEQIAEVWKNVGAEVRLEVYDIGVLNNTVLRPREYDALFFGQIIGRDLDPFPFWHASQRNDPGLNIALYANITVDELVERIRTTLDTTDRRDLLVQFEQEINDEAPAVFVYAPDFIYLVHPDLKGFALGTVTTPAERFLNVHEWHLKTQKVWPIFANVHSLLDY